MNKKNSLFEFDSSFLGSQNIQAITPFTIHNSPFTILIGTDEAGRGPGAGGVFASAVYFPKITKELIQKLSCLNDSKQLSKKKREELYDIIMENSINSTVCIEVEEIEKINILNSSLKAMKLACSNVILNSFQDLSSEQTKSILTLVDGNKLIKDFIYPQKFIIKGDSKSASIAAASILAKVTRDRYMQELHEKFPQYNWIKNAGYLTREHLSAIDEYGITPHHRKSFLKKHEARQLSLLS